MTETKQCPACREDANVLADVCPHCGRKFWTAYNVAWAAAKVAIVLALGLLLAWWLGSNIW